ncbi:hypothetical protein ENUP19_0305G0012 [Entamoeba nuttalli]|uniref:Ras family protein n=2 Tax=Entamoeba nuttalli TaxID=412467 RepID=K2GQY6_ENTNP|nr:hypothetical protein ENU1_199080 [Entamoeba nuttalli P19]EKE37388.1 hypothetical protein ENU1_199080 [Entamoeba nuttalli P19]|eukprot:XP_008860274.1 hypothetical protein ENU1_199080 [Entamoeba nuttalli P19]
MTDVNICLFGLSQSGKTTFSNIVRGGEFQEDFVETQSRTQDRFTFTIDKISFNGSIYDEPGNNFKDLKATVSTYATSGLIHIFIGSETNPTDCKFIEHYIEQPQYKDCVNDDNLICVIMTKKDLVQEFDTTSVKAAADSYKGLFYELDLHDIEMVKKVFGEILSKYAEMKGIKPQPKQESSKKSGKKDTSKKEKKGVCILF